MNIACLFEQSGTFKNILICRGHNAIDIDIDDMFNQTDVKTDIFKDIEQGGYGWYIEPADVVFAFFPCTWFSCQNDLILNGTSYSMKNWSPEQKQEYINKRQSERERSVAVLESLVDYCFHYGKPLIIENPAGSYIRKVLGEPTLSHKRGLYGDWCDKPTWWYLYNCSFDNNKLQRIDNKRRYTHVKQPHHSDKQRKINRSLIAPEYAENFINCILLGGGYFGQTL